MRGKAFFTKEMARQLREIRERAGLTQFEVAQRTGMAGRKVRTLVGWLEAGQVGRPLLDTIVKFLRACGARVSDFCAQYDAIEPVALDTRILDRSGLNA